MANGIKQANNGFSSIYKGNFSIGINNISYGETANTGFWETIPATGTSTGEVVYAYLPKGSNGPSIYEMSTDPNGFITAANQIRKEVDGPFISNPTFTTTRNISIPTSSTASTYPLEFNVSGITQDVDFVSVTLGVMSGDNVQKLGIVLVAPDNTTYALLKGSLNSPQSTSGQINVQLTNYKGIKEFNPFQWNGFTTGVYRPTTQNGSQTLAFDAPCPVGQINPGQNVPGLSVFDFLPSGDTNGTWSLYIQDFGGGDSTILYANLSITTGALWNADDVFSWAESDNNVILINRNYPNVNTSGLQLLIDPWYLPSANASYTYSNSVKISDLTNNNNNATPFNGTISLNGTNYESWAMSNNPFTFNTVTNIPAGNSAYTTSVWFKTTSYNQGLITFGGTDPYTGNYLYVNGGGSITNNWETDSITSTGSTSLPNNNWHNAVVTYDGTIATIYIDGVFDTDRTIGSSLSVSPTSNLAIGDNAGGEFGLSDFQGSMGPVMIYNRALTASEVLTNYNSINDSHGYII